MLTSLLLVSQLLLMSDRASFWDPDNISDQTQQDTSSLQQEIQGKNVLLLVHGYNETAEDALSRYRLINTNLSTSAYDYVIGYLWPAYDDAWDYFKAKHHAKELSKTMRSHLEFFANSAAKLDVLAHSMGNFLMLEALDYHIHDHKKLVQNFFALAPAVDNESIEKKEKYYQSTKNCGNLFIFYSQRDDVLKWGYNVAELDRALGYEGAEHPDQLPKNVHLMDYTNYVDGHSGYFTFLPIYDFIKNQFFSQSPIKIH